MDERHDLAEPGPEPAPEPEPDREQEPDLEPALAPDLEQEPEPDDGFGSEVDDLAFGLIAAAAQARGLAFEALAAAKAGDFARCDERLAEAEHAAIEAHALQTALIVREANGEHLPVDVMLVHAQDHLMTSLLARELIAELIELRRTDQASQRGETPCPETP